MGYGTPPCGAAFAQSVTEAVVGYIRARRIGRDDPPFMTPYIQRDGRASLHLGLADADKLLDPLAQLPRRKGRGETWTVIEVAVAESAAERRCGCQCHDLSSTPAGRSRAGPEPHQPACQPC